MRTIYYSRFHWFYVNEQALFLNRHFLLSHLPSHYSLSSKTRLLPKIDNLLHTLTTLGELCFAKLIRIVATSQPGIGSLVPGSPQAVASRYRKEYGIHLIPWCQALSLFPKTLLMTRWCLRLYQTLYLIWAHSLLMPSKISASLFPARGTRLHEVELPMGGFASNWVSRWHRYRRGTLCSISAKPDIPSVPSRIKHGQTNVSSRWWISSCLLNVCISRVYSSILGQASEASCQPKGMALLQSLQCFLFVY